MQSRSIPLVVGLAALGTAWGFLAATSGLVDPASRPLLDAVGFALSTPAGLAFVTYLSSAFEFEAYYGSRSASGLAGDFLLAVLAAITVGIPAATVVAGLTDSTTVLFLVSTLVTFLGAFATFAWRTSEFFVAAPADGEGDSD